MTLALTFTSVCDPACICPNLCQDEIKCPRTATQNTNTPRHTFIIKIQSIKKVSLGVYSQTLPVLSKLLSTSLTLRGPRLSLREHIEV